MPPLLHVKTDPPTGLATLSRKIYDTFAGLCQAPKNAVVSTREVNRLESKLRQQRMGNGVFLSNLRDPRLRVFGVPRVQQNRRFELTRQRTQGISSTGYMPMRDDECDRSETAGSQLTKERHQRREIRVDEWRAKPAGRPGRCAAPGSHKSNHHSVALPGPIPKNVLASQ
jgi:hypothetical protein